MKRWKNAEYAWFLLAPLMSMGCSATTEDQSEANVAKATSVIRDIGAVLSTDIMYFVAYQGLINTVQAGTTEIDHRSSFGRTFQKVEGKWVEGKPDINHNHPTDNRLTWGEVKRFPDVTATTFRTPPEEFHFEMTFARALELVGEHVATNERKLREPAASYFGPVNTNPAARSISPTPILLNSRGEYSETNEHCLQIHYLPEKYTSVSVPNVPNGTVLGWSAHHCVSPGHEI